MKPEILSVANFVSHLIRLSLKFEKYKDKNVSEETLLKFRNSFYRVLQDHWHHHWTFCLCSDERFEDPNCINLFQKTIVQACEQCDLSVDFLSELLPPVIFFMQDNRLYYKIGYDVTSWYKERYKMYGISYKEIPEQFDYSKSIALHYE